MSIRRPPVPGTDDAHSSDDADVAEDRMRRALGLMGPNSREIPAGKSAAAPATPAEASSSRRPGQPRGRTEGTPGYSETAASLSRRAAELEDQLAGERARHDETRSQVQQVELAARALEAQLQRSALAGQEELDAARQATVTAQRALDEASFEIRKPNTTARADSVHRRAVVEPATANQAEPSVARTKTTPHAVALAQSAAEPTPAKKRGRPRLHPVSEPKPVRWWTASFRARAKG